MAYTNSHSSGHYLVVLQSADNNFKVADIIDEICCGLWISHFFYGYHIFTVSCRIDLCLPDGANSRRMGDSYLDECQRL